MNEHSNVERLILDLRDPQVAAGGLPAADYGLSEADAAAHGLLLGMDGQVRLPSGTGLLHEKSILAALDPAVRAWLQELTLLPVVGSTNTWLLEQAAKSRLEGRVVFAECQVAGRGRRGKQWHSPIGANLAMTLGFTLDVPLSELGGLSLVVGLALIDALDPTGSVGLGVKWPNDLLHTQGKLAGVLVELAQFQGQAQIVVGIGVNWRIRPDTRELIGQPVADAQTLLPQLDRNRGAAAIITHVVRYVAHFAEVGFEPMIPAYNSSHVLHNRDCHILQPNRTIDGQVLGVGADGSLLVNVAGEVTPFASGEVSIRPH